MYIFLLGPEGNWQPLLAWLCLLEGLWRGMMFRYHVQETIQMSEGNHSNTCYHLLMVYLSH